MEDSKVDEEPVPVSAAATLIISSQNHNPGLPHGNL